jgi:hypothetical protein
MQTEMRAAETKKFDVQRADKFATRGAASRAVCRSTSDERNL